MTTLLQNISYNLLKIDVAENTGNFLNTLPTYLEDLQTNILAYNALPGADLTSIDVMRLQTSYQVAYGPFFNAFDGFYNPYLNYIFVGGDYGNLAIGGFGNDILLGGAGNDVLMGGAGSNTIWGGGGDDVIFGGANSYDAVLPAGLSILVTPPQFLYGGDGNDQIFGGNGSTTLTGVGVTGGIDTHSGGNYLSGGAGDDLLVGADGSSTLNGTNVIFSRVSHYGGNTLDGGDGNDSLFGGSIHGTLLDTFDVLDTLHVTAFQRTYGVSNNLYGGSGDDNLVGGDGNIFVKTINVHLDAIDYIAGNNLYGGSGNDQLFGQNITFTEVFVTSVGVNIHNFGNSYLDGGSGNDLLVGDVQSMSITMVGSPSFVQEEHLGSDKLIGGSGNDILVGDAVNVTTDPEDLVIGGNNILYGGQGNDILTGGIVNNAAADFVAGHNKFVYDGLVDNGHDLIMDFNVAKDVLVGQHGATFSDGGLVGGNLVINVHHDAGVGSTITLMNIHTDIFGSIVQSNATVV
jgi:Ca2+-binding RTX toxin-like protein